jgi:hypothetical protein
MKINAMTLVFITSLLLLIPVYSIVQWGGKFG